MTKLLEQVYEPIFEAPENFILDIGGKRVGERIKIIIDYEIVEKTKSYMILKVNNSYVLKTKRSF